jgi:hypothetical protein
VDAKLRTEILDRYGAVLENNACTVGRLRDLPYGKSLIRRALLDELLNNDDPQLQTHLKVGLMWLEAFVSDEEFAVVSKHEANMKETSRRMETEGANALLQAKEADTWEAYSEILRQVHAEQEQTMSCVRRLFPPAEGI